MTHSLRGVATISLWAEDHKDAVVWYGKLFNQKPYFERPGYAEFRIGDHQTEVGIIDRKYAPHMAFPGSPSGVVLYWHVDDLSATYAWLLKEGATSLQEPEDRGHGFVTATAVDPFGNVLGIMYNPHYVEVSQK
ncbi:MAG TPA: VOC family protein [Candidatus Saccharimonadia bacterium]|nr:VOC family protein [Candidatus Saccharimonadia bacterium]